MFDTVAPKEELVVAPTGEYLYFDVLDTDRTAERPDPDAKIKAEECTLLGAAELKLAVLRGHIPVFPQAYGWDSTALLAFSTMTEKNPLEGAAFRTIVRDGHIRIRLRNGFSSLWDAALYAFRPDSGYSEFGSWPELNLEGGSVERAAVVEAMQTQRPSADIPEAVRGRLETLDALSRDVLQAPPVERELKRENKVASLIESASKVAREIRSPLAPTLIECTQRSQVIDPNNRTAIYAFLKEKARRLTEEGKSDRIIYESREVTNACFNVIAAQCVGAKAALTFPLISPEASRVMNQTLQDSTRTEVLQGIDDQLGKDEVSELEVVSWDRVQDILNTFVTLKPLEKERQAAAAKLIAETVANGAKRYVVRTQRKYILAQSLLWGATSFLGGVLDSTQNTPGFFSGLAGATAGALGALRSEQDETDRQITRLEAKWLGVIQQGPGIRSG